MNYLTIIPKGPLRGTVHVPGDKSITHRALILSALAEGSSTLRGYCRGEDCLNTLSSLQQLGIPIEVEPDKVHVSGKGLWGLNEPAKPLDCGNSGRSNQRCFPNGSGFMGFETNTGQTSGVVVSFPQPQFFAQGKDKVGRSCAAQ